MNREKGSDPQFEAPNLPPETAGQSSEKAVEKRPSTQEPGSGKKTPAVLNAPPKPVTPAAIPGKTPTTTDDTSSQTSDISSVIPAEDGDLIEKQWVQRAKAIVSKTQDDPYSQKKEMSKVKADYIHKRFKKVVKTDDSFDKTQSRPEQSRTGDAVTK